MKRGLLLVCIGILFHMLNGQEHTLRLFPIKGLVRDRLTRQPLASANILVLGMNLGTITNGEGRFTLLLPAGRHRIVIQYIGYKNDTLEVVAGPQQKMWNIFLQPAPLMMAPIEVVAERYSPAEKVILKAIENKKRFWKRLKNYQCRAYARSTVWSIVHRKGKIDTVIGVITETQVKGQFRAPDDYRETIEARRQSRNLMASLNFLTPGRIPNLNDDVIPLYTNRIISPTHPRALDYYQFQMLDTVMQDRFPVYVLRFQPRSRTIPLFSGKLWIIDSLFQVIAMKVHTNDAVDLGAMKDVSYEGHFACFSDSFYLPISVSMRARVDFGFPSFPPTFLEQKVVFYDYRINQPQMLWPEDNLVLAVSDSADRRTEQYWRRHQKIPLTLKELRAYQEIDSVMKHRPSARLISLLFQLPFQMRNWHLGDLADFYHFHRVDGHYVGVGFQWPGKEPWIAPQIRVGYGLASKKWQAHFRVGKLFLRQNGLAFMGRMELFRKIVPMGQGQPFSPNLVTATALLAKEDYYDYYFSQGIRFALRLAMHSSLAFQAGLGIYRDKSVTRRTQFSLLARRKIFPPNPAIREWGYRHLFASVVYDSRQFFQVGSQAMPNPERNSIQVQFQGNLGLPSGDQSERFWWVRMSTMWHRFTFWGGYLDGMLEYGYGEHLPKQRQFIFYSPYAGTTGFGIFKSPVLTREKGSRVWQLFLEHHFGRWPINWLPGVRKIVGDLVVFVNIGKMNGQRSIQEAGIAFSRLFSLLRLNCAWCWKPRRLFSLSLEMAL